MPAPSPRRRLLLLLGGLLLVQAAWLVSVPAFRGIDEFDHVYRAASVARGQWLPSGELPRDGRGELVTAPRDLVVAAGPECTALGYSGPDNCTPVSELGGGLVSVASAASRYHPGYYWVVGTAARGASGGDAVLAMRAVSGLLCALFVVLAAWTASCWARTRWPAVSLLLCLTPVVAYSTVVVAPNALEIVAAVSVWAALSGLREQGVPPALERRLLWSAVPGAVVLATARTLGIGFLGAIVLTAALLLGRRGTMRLLRRRAGTLVPAAAVVGAGVLSGAWWLLAVRPNRLEQHLDQSGALVGTLVSLPIWLLQSLAAAPGRTEPAPGLVYVLCGGVVAALVLAGVRVARPRLRVALLAIACVSVTLPVALTLRTFSDVGVIWQGRYGLPLSLGLVLLAGLALDDHGDTGSEPGVGAGAGAGVAAAAAAGTGARGPRRRTVLVGAGLVTVAQVLAVAHVLAGQRRDSPSVAAGLWQPPATALVVMLALAGCGLLTWWVALPPTVRPAGRPSEGPPASRTQPGRVGHGGAAPALRADTAGSVAGSGAVAVAGTPDRSPG